MWTLGYIERLQEKIVHLEPQSEEDEDSESSSEALICPVQIGTSSGELGHDDGGPGPESTLEGNDDCKAVACANLQRDLDPVDPVLCTVHIQPRITFKNLTGWHPK